MNVYEALGGQLYDQWDREPETVRITENRVRPKITSYSIVAEIGRLPKRLSEARPRSSTNDRTCPSTPWASRRRCRSSS